MPTARQSILSDESFATMVAVAIVGCQWWITDELRVPTKWALPGLATLLAGAIVFLRLLPRQQKRERMRLRAGLLGVLVVANFANLLALGAQAFFDAQSGAIELLFTGLILWTMNVLVFGLVYWVLDGGGPEARAGKGPVLRDFVFPQHNDETNTPREWRTAFGDYLYLAFTGAIAFGPTDAMPYTRRAKAAMTVEGAFALATLGVIIARAVSLASS
jgi:uncharacterized membrane protein